MALDSVGRTKRGEHYDIDVGEVDDDTLGGLISQHVAVKGFCVLAPGFYKAAVPAKAQEEAEDLEFYQVNGVVAEGLLGPEGSASVAVLESGVDSGARSEGPSLIAVDDGFTRLWSMLVPYADQFGLALSRRSNAVAHRAGDAEEETPPLTEKEVTKWQSQFLRHSFMLIAFLGPKGGVLELQPHSISDTEPWQIRTVPGQVVILRADTMVHRHSSAGEALAVSCFLMEPDRRGLPVGGNLLTPAARALEEWTISRLKELKDEEEQRGQTWDPDIPRGWQAAMNHSFRRGQAAGIAGASCYFPGTRDSEAWFQASTSGVDYATAVPLTRWDHAPVYDPAKDSHLRMKTSCMHCAYMEGTELFDNKFFSLSPFEAQGLDPHHRLLLEVGYLALHNMGLKKKNLMNAPGGVYVGMTNNEWSFRGGMTPHQVVGGLQSFASGRISFCLGMKGPALTISTEAASGLSATLLAADSVQQKGTAVGTEFAIGIGVHLLLSPVWWSNESMSGLLSPEGRCLTFDANASGYIWSDGCASVGIKNATNVVDGEVVRNDQDVFLATIAGGKLSSSGQSSSMHAPNSAAEQQVIADAVRNASVSHADVDGVEPHGSGSFLSDAVELNAIWRAHRSDLTTERLGVTAVKTSVGNQVECAGISSLIKIVYAARFGYQSPTLHLKQANPLFDSFEQPMDILSESLEFPFRSTFNGAKARGLGGSNVYVLAWGMLAEEQRFAAPDTEDRFPRKRPLPSFWPGGGGELEDHMRPKRRDGYFIAGTWSQWKGSQKMEPEGNSTYTCTVTLGENRWDKFQIWLDGDPQRALHPGEPKAPQGSAVVGPGTATGEPTPLASTSNLAPTWLLDGRSWHVPAEEQSEFAVENPDIGAPGDQYRVRLEIAGRWRMLSWEKVTTRALRAVESQAIVASSGASSYFVAASWSEWELEEMNVDDANPGFYFLDVRLPPPGGGEFQIVRDADWDQAFYPSRVATEDYSSAEVLGPDDHGMDMNWLLRGHPGDVFRIEFQRMLESGYDRRTVSWRKL